ncbi:MAG: hypothetical protein Q9211_006623 [Gyalolechia sp. 1 TL-2023]
MPEHTPATALPAFSPSKLNLSPPPPLSASCPLSLPPLPPTSKPSSSSSSPNKLSPLPALPLLRERKNDGI